MKKLSWLWALIKVTARLVSAQWQHNHALRMVDDYEASVVRERESLRYWIRQEACLVAPVGALYQEFDRIYYSHRSRKVAR